MKDLLLLGKRVRVEDSPLLLQSAPDEHWLRDWQILGGSWRCEDGYLYGAERQNLGGILLSRARFEGDVLLRFRASSVPPATRDLNGLYCAEWDEAAGYLGRGYIAGLNGWYDHKCGIERFPENGLNATHPLYHYQPGREVELCMGAVRGHNFLAVDGELIAELIDPNPLAGGRVGFSPYCTQLRIRHIEVRQIRWEARDQVYECEF